MVSKKYFPCSGPQQARQVFVIFSNWPFGAHLWAGAARGPGQARSPVGATASRPRPAPLPPDWLTVKTASRGIIIKARGDIFDWTQRGFRRCRSWPRRSSALPAPLQRRAGRAGPAASGAQSRAGSGLGYTAAEPLARSGRVLTAVKITAGNIPQCSFASHRSSRGTWKPTRALVALRGPCGRRPHRHAWWARCAPSKGCGAGRPAVKRLQMLPQRGLQELQDTN